MRRILIAFTTVLLAALLVPSLSKADNFSFTGNLSAGNQVLVFDFSVGALSNVILETWSYAGGTNAAGTVIPRGGFDPILAVFDSTGALIGQNDDGDFVKTDITGRQFDTFLNLTTLAAGDYSVAVMQYNNFANGPNFSNGFAESADPNFATLFNGGTCGTDPYVDVADAGANSCRDSHWAFDILGVNSAVVVGATPEPSTLVLFGSGLLGLAASRKRKHLV
jgi:hypothetical protein